jgi:hypothetical protein
MQVGYMHASFVEKEGVLRYCMVTCQKRVAYYCLQLYVNPTFQQSNIARIYLHNHV